MKKTPLDLLNEVAYERGYSSWYEVYNFRNHSDCNIIPQEASIRYAKQCAEEAVEKLKG